MIEGSYLHQIKTALSLNKVATNFTNKLIINAEQYNVFFQVARLRRPNVNTESEKEMQLGI